MIDSLKLLGTKYISISGGEPFLRKDIFEVIEYIKKKDLRLHISSNGTLITKELAKKINNVGLDVVSISLDAVTPELHNRIRGSKEAFDMAIAAIENLTSYNGHHTQVGINTTITDLNLDELPKLVEFANDLEVDAIRFRPWHRSLGHDETENILCINEGRFEDLNNVIEQIIRMAKKYDIYTNSETYLRGIELYLRDKNRINVECFVGSFTCNISWMGDVVPCAFIPAIGNVRNESFEKIWNSKQFNNARKDITKGNCQKCWMDCFIEPSLRCSLNYAIKNPMKYINDLRFYRSL